MSDDHIITLANSRLDFQEVKRYFDESKKISNLAAVKLSGGKGYFFQGATLGEEKDFCCDQYRFIYTGCHSNAEHGLTRKYYKIKDPERKGKATLPGFERDVYYLTAKDKKDVPVYFIHYFEDCFAHVDTAHGNSKAKTGIYLPKAKNVMEKVKEGAEKNVTFSRPAAMRCQRRWRTLRTAYGKEHRKRILRRGNSSLAPTKSWPYYKPLSFLARHVKHRDDDPSFIRLESSFSDDFASESISSGSGASDHNNDETPTHIPIYDPVNLRTDFGMNGIGQSMPEMASSSLPNEHILKCEGSDLLQEYSEASVHRKTNRNLPQKQASYHTDLQQVAQYRSQEMDNIDHFGMFIAAQLKTKPHAMVEAYMKRITDIIFSDVVVEVTIAEQHSSESSV